MIERITTTILQEGFALMLITWFSCVHKMKVVNFYMQHS